MHVVILVALWVIELLIFVLLVCTENEQNVDSRTRQRNMTQHGATWFNNQWMWTFTTPFYYAFIEHSEL